MVYHTGTTASRRGSGWNAYGRTARRAFSGYRACADDYQEGAFARFIAHQNNASRIGAVLRVAWKASNHAHIITPVFFCCRADIAHRCTRVLRVGGVRAA